MSKKSKCDICENKIGKNDVYYCYTVKREVEELGIVHDGSFKICNSCKNANIEIFPTINLVGVKLKTEAQR
jgi:hypothetical protein